MIEVIGAILGAVLASGLQCLAMRRMNGQSWVSGHSSCDVCGERLSTRVLIPIISFFLLQGQTHCCKKKLSRLYPFVELLGAIGGFVIGYFSVEQGGLWVLLSILLLGACLYTVVTDGLYQLISLPVILLMGLMLFIGSGMDSTGWMGAAIGGVFFGVQWLGTRGKGIGTGDIALGIAMGFSLGAIMVLPAILFGYILALVPALYGLATKRLNTKSKISIGSYLSVAWFCGWIFLFQGTAFLLEFFSYFF